MNSLYSPYIGPVYINHSLVTDYWLCPVYILSWKGVCSHRWSWKDWCGQWLWFQWGHCRLSRVRGGRSGCGRRSSQKLSGWTFQPGCCTSYSSHLNRRSHPGECGRTGSPIIIVTHYLATVVPARPVGCQGQCYWLIRRSWGCHRPRYSRPPFWGCI